MRNKIKLWYLVLLLGLLSGCGERAPKPEKYYLFETADYVDFDDSCRVIYVKSHRQLIKDTTFYILRKCSPGPCYKVYNALGQEMTIGNIQSENYPKLAIDTSDGSYDIVIHMHSPADSIMIINSAVELRDIDLIRYYMPEIVKIDSTRSIFQFLYPLEMLWDYEVDTCGGFIYTLDLMNYDSIDFEHGERVVLKYDNYRIPIPYQIF